MTQQSKDLLQKPKQPFSLPLEKSNEQKLKAEQHEVAGMHKNTGQKDHKGAR